MEEDVLPNDSEVKSLAQLLDTDDETASRILLLVDSTEALRDNARAMDGILPELALEGFGDGMRFFDAILTWLKTVAEALFDEMSAHELAARAVEFKAANLKVSSRDRRQNPSNNQPLKITTRVQSLCINYRPVRDVAQLLGTLRYMGEVVNEYYRFNQAVAQGLPGVLSAARNYRDPMQLVGQLEGRSPLGLLANSAVLTSGDEPGSYASHHLMGGYRLVVTNRGNSGETLAQVKSTTVRLKTSSVTPLPYPAQVVLPRFNLTTSDQVLSTIISQAKTLQGLNTLVIRQQRKGKLRELINAIEGLRRIASSNAGDSTIVGLVEQAATLLEAYSDWMSNPYIGLYSLACRNLRAALNVCEQNAM